MDLMDTCTVNLVDLQIVGLVVAYTATAYIADFVHALMAYFVGVYIAGVMDEYKVDAVDACPAGPVDE